MEQTFFGLLFILNSFFVRRLFMVILLWRKYFNLYYTKPYNIPNRHIEIRNIFKYLFADSFHPQKHFDCDGLNVILLAVINIKGTVA
jgi:hypothetical protein